jgi:hypothetical protein
MEAPESEPAEKTEFAGMQEEFNSMSVSMSMGKVLLVRCFDRGADGTRVHVEDVAQLLGRYPSEKYAFGLPSPTRRSRDRSGLLHPAVCGGIAGGE